MFRTEMIDCGSGLPHGQHTAYEEDGVTYLCEGRRKSVYVHCGEPETHAPHRNGPDQTGPWCQGIMSIEEMTQHYKLPVTRLTTHEIAALLQGETITASDSEGKKVYIAKHTPNTLMDANEKAREGIDPATLPPPMTYAEAERLTRGI